MRKFAGLPMAAVLVLLTALGLVGNAGFAFASEQVSAAHKQPPKDKTVPASAVISAPAPRIYNQSARKVRALAAPMVHVGKAKKPTPEPKPTKKP